MFLYHQFEGWVTPVLSEQSHPQPKGRRECKESAGFINTSLRQERSFDQLSRSIQHIRGYADLNARLMVVVWNRFISQRSMHFYGWKLGLKTGMYYLRTKATAGCSVRRRLQRSEWFAECTFLGDTHVELRAIHNSHLGVFGDLAEKRRFRVDTIDHWQWTGPEVRTLRYYSFTMFYFKICGMRKCKHKALEGSFSAVSKPVLEVDIHLFFFEIYKNCALLHSSKLNMFAKCTLVSPKFPR